MIRSRSPWSAIRMPLAGRLVSLLLVFAVIPALVTYGILRLRVQQTFVQARLETMDAQARLYSFRVQSAPEERQNLTLVLSNLTPGHTFFLLGTDGLYQAHSDPAKVGTPASADLGIEFTRLLLSRVTLAYSDPGRDLLVATYRSDITAPAAVVLSGLESRAVPFQQASSYLMGWLSLALVAVVIAAGVAVYRMLGPTRQLSDFANRLGERDFQTDLDPARFNGELRRIAESLMSLAGKIKAMLGELDQRVRTRTAELEHRAVQLKATADIGKAITSMRTLTELLSQAAQLISDRFGYYHVGIYLLDDRRVYAVLSASNSEGGRRLLGKNHRLKVGETGIVGFVAENLKARIALDTGEDAVFFDNPDLPDTRSEMALPLVASGQALGVLDVQSREARAFTDEDVAVLQTLADQLAIAIENVNLNNETRRALETASLVSGTVSREAWKRILSNQPRIGYLATLPGTVPAGSEAMEPGMLRAFTSGELVQEEDGVSMSLPIKIRGEVIGAIRLKKSDIAEAWSQEEANLALSLADQLSGALESARLYRESQQRAVRESLVSDISAKLSMSSRMDAILRETVQEIGQALGNTKVTFQLRANSTPPAGPAGTRGDGKPGQKP